MKKNLFAWIAFVAVAFVFTGCTRVQNYSIRSYQGPLPIDDYQHVNAEQYGVPVTPR